MKKILFLTLIATLGANAQEAFLPPTMGWSSWNTFGANISEDIITNQARLMVEKGFADAGYKYINIDDGYFANREESGRLIIHPTRFPNGMKPVVDYIHSLGLKAGCYSDAGHNTCASRWGGETGGVGAGMYEHDQEDCEMYFNEFGFDFIKVDFCGGVNYHNVENLDLDPRERYTAIRAAIDATGHPEIVFNACRWDYPGTWISDVADSWRISGDINASWGSVRDIIKQSLYLAPYCGGGHYNDMDMLEVGRGLSNDEDLTHFGIWCIMSSPLLIGCDMGRVSDNALKIMTNADLIALNQDPLGIQAYVAKKTDDGAYFLVKDVEQLYGLSRAVALYNPTDEQLEVTLNFADVDLGGNVAIKDLATHRSLGVNHDSYTCKLRPHATRFLRLDADLRLMRTLYEGEHAYLPEYQELVNNSWAETATYSENAICHNGAAAGWLGKKENNNLQWRNVMVPEDGEYDMSVYYLSGETRYIDVLVNGVKQTRVSCNSGGWDKVKPFTLNIHLKAGENVITLANPTGWMPDIDYMTLEYNDASLEASADDANRPGKLYDLNGREVANPDCCPTAIYIKDGRKILLRR